MSLILRLSPERISKLQMTPPSLDFNVNKTSADFISHPSEGTSGHCNGNGHGSDPQPPLLVSDLKGNIAYGEWLRRK